MDTIEKRVREGAYYLWLQEGRPHGRDQEHWERAHALLGLAKGDGGPRLPPPTPEQHDGRRATAAADPVRAQAAQTTPDRLKTTNERSAGSPGKSGGAKKASAPRRKDKSKAAKP